MVSAKIKSALSERGQFIALIPLANSDVDYYRQLHINKQGESFAGYEFKPLVDSPNIYFDLFKSVFPMSALQHVMHNHEFDVEHFNQFLLSWLPEIRAVRKVGNTEVARVPLNEKKHFI